jgi:hypothetical protein
MEARDREAPGSNPGPPTNRGGTNPVQTALRRAPRTRLSRFRDRQAPGSNSEPPPSVLVNPGFPGDFPVVSKHLPSSHPQRFYVLRWEFQAGGNWGFQTGLDRTTCRVAANPARVYLGRRKRWRKSDILSTAVDA